MDDSATHEPDAVVSEDPGRPRSGKRVGAYLPYVVAVALAVLLVVVTQSRTDPSAAAQDVLDGQQLKIMAPANPGGGWDQTARAMQAALQDVVGRSEVYNVGGAGGTIGLSQFKQLTGQPNQLMVMGLVMVGAIEANDSSSTLADVTPIAKLTSDSQLIVVPASSPIKDVGDLKAALEKDTHAVSWAGGSAGGAEQILAGLVVQGLGLDPSEVNYIAHSGGGEAIATLLSGSATVGVSGVSELQPQVDAGTLRAIVVSGEERDSSMPKVPTLKESGIDVTLTNWRGVVAPKGLSAEQQAGLEKIVVDMTKTDSWQESLSREGWTDELLVGTQFATFLDAEVTRVTKVVQELGLGDG